MDFNSALARLLRDGAMRVAFRGDPGGVVEAMRLAPREAQALAALRFEDLEVQADILLRKRFDAVARLVPRTCETSGWEAFRAYARLSWPESAEADAAGFCQYAGCPVPSESHRASFAAGRGWFACYWLSRGPAGPAGLQLFLRIGSRWREWVFRVRL